MPEVGPSGEAPPERPPQVALAVVAAGLAVAVGATGAGLLLPGAELGGSARVVVRAAAVVVGVAGLLVLTSRLGGPARTPWRELPVVLGTAAIVFAAVAVATFPFSPVELDSGVADDQQVDDPTTTTTRPTTTTTVADDDEPDEVELPALGGLLQALALFALLAVVVWAAVVLIGTARLASWWRGLSADPPELEQGGTIDVAAAQAGLEASLDAVRSDAAPRDAIGDAYARLLAALEAAGAGRRSEEAPHEHLDRVLGPLGVRSAPLHELAELFVYARFSQHPVTDGHRARAVAALGEALEDLRARRAVDAAGGAHATDHPGAPRP